MRCFAVCTAQQYHLRQIANYCRAKGYDIHFHRNILAVNIPEDQVELYFFQDGCFVYWGPKRNRQSDWITTLAQFSKTPLKNIESDYFIVRDGDETSLKSHERFNLDIITLEKDNAQVKLALSIGLAQSVKLQAFESVVMQNVRSNRDLPGELANSGKISLSRKNLSQRMGKIFIVRTMVNLNSEFLTVPKFIWHNPGLESYYTFVADFLDIESRVDSLNKKLDALHETLDILSAELQHRHSSLLEIIIIALIAVEIVLTLMQWH